MVRSVILKLVALLAGTGIVALVKALKRADENEGFRQEYEENNARGIYSQPYLPDVPATPDNAADGGPQI